MTAETTKVAAILVTFNRRDLLIRCLHSLVTENAGLQAIFVVDNASTDGTPQLLLEKGFIKEIPPPSGKYTTRLCLSASPELVYMRLKDNEGGAGGFAEGIKAAYMAGYDWLWLMDDDGLPKQDSVRTFLEYNPNPSTCYCSVIHDGSDDNNLSCGFLAQHEGKRILFDTLASIAQFRQKYGRTDIEGTGNFFNGVFISHQIITEVGYPQKEMFIHGDENEYLFRIISQGFCVKIMLNLIFLHPRPKVKVINVLWHKMQVAESAPWKHYFQTRNTLYLSSHYGYLYGVHFPYLKALMTEALKLAVYPKARKHILLAILDYFLHRPYRPLKRLCE
jgi:rhamnopyranosyl-N-acetylglucosaminyl-diphospho-decaprenol beta-1,3/1,4-galactofuranosyltransferase